LNGSNARAYEMFLVDPKTKVMGPPMWVIGTDGGYLDNPVKIDPNAPKGQLQRLTMLPGERYEVIIDFNDPTWRAQNPNFSGSLILKNVAKTPYPGGETPEGSTLGQMMKFVVGAPPQSDPSYNPRTDGPIRQGAQKIVRLVNPATGTLAAGVTPNVTRQLTLNEIMGMPQTAINPITGELVNYEGGPLEILVNNTKWDGRHAVGAEDGMYVTEPIPGFVPDNPNSSVISYLSELPKEGETEIWEIVNLTADAHPIHFHLVQFQLLNRQAFNTNHYPSVYAAAFPGGGYDRMTGQPYPAGVFMPAWGPPLDYYSGNPRAVGGNPDITPYLQGPIRPPLANEAGWKDTVIMLPGQVTRVVVRWAPTDKLVGDTNLHYPFDPAVNEAGYVWHCHIIDHEDNEMMRPDKVVPKPGATRTYIQGEDY
jgi:FtsP/CotA-like multicopper oxidase with cupredoxin domain